MTTFNLSAPTRTLVRLPTRQEVRAMLNRPAVAITAIVAGLVAFLAVLGGVVLLAYYGKSTEAITGLLGGSLLALVINIRSKVNDLHAKVDQTTGSN